MEEMIEEDLGELKPHDGEDQKQKTLNKIVDLMGDINPVLLSFPKYERHEMVADIKKCMRTAIERSIEANKKYYKKTTLQELDVEVEKLRKYIRIAHRLKYISDRQYKYWSGRADEIGKLVGGWINSVKR